MNAAELLDVLVSDVLATGPAAAQVFRSRGMACAGCPFAPFETVAEVAASYGIDAESLACALAEAAASSDTKQRIEP